MKITRVILFIAVTTLALATIETTRRGLTRSRVWALLTAQLAAMYSLMDACEMFRYDFERYPTEEEGLAMLFLDPRTDVVPEGYRGPYADPALFDRDEQGRPLDYWGNPLRYIRPLQVEGVDDEYGIFSCGPDGVSETRGQDPDDINSWAGAGPEAKAKFRRRLDNDRLGRRLVIGELVLAILIVGGLLFRSFNKRKREKPPQD